LALKYRITLVVVLLAGLVVASIYTGIADGLDANAIRNLMNDAGPWGWSLYILVFAGGEFIHIPGMVFVAAGILVYGKVIGFGLALTASVISVCFSFVVVRLLGGTPLGEIDSRG
jgi:uncharacterized membrane protein YdjX (TVP38/TMEM64 family)